MRCSSSGGGSEECIRLNAVWTPELPPLGGYYWWRWNEHAVPTVAYLWDHEGEWVWHAVAHENTHVEQVHGDNGWWWPMPVVMPPLTQAMRAAVVSLGDRSHPRDRVHQAIRNACHDAAND